MTCLGAVILFAIQFGIPFSLSPVGGLCGGGFWMATDAVNVNIRNSGTKKVALATVVCGLDYCSGGGALATTRAILLAHFRRNLRAAISIFFAVIPTGRQINNAGSATSSAYIPRLNFHLLGLVLLLACRGMLLLRHR